MDWDDAYTNAAYIPGAERYPGLWAREAAAFREVAAHDLDIPYGARARERYDLFFPEGAARGLFVFVHGGYWLDFDKSSWSHLASAAVDHGWAAMLPSYDLCPDVSVGEITAQIGSALNHAAARESAGPIVLSGHSAGGHLAARMMCAGAPIEAEVAARIRRAVGISGLYDLRPLRHTQMNERLRITDEIARAESPLLLEPREGAELIAWVGGEERPEFLRQSRDFVADWKAKGARVEFVEDPGRHHFDVIEALADPHSEMSRRAFAD